MTEKELHKLKRSELLEIMLEQSKEITRLRKELFLAEQKLKKREIALREVGSIAEASLSLSNVFAQAQEAADIYLDNVKRICAMQAEQHGVAEQWDSFTKEQAQKDYSSEDEG